MHENFSKKQQMDLSDFARNLFSNDFLHDITDLSGYARNILSCNGKTLGICVFLQKTRCTPMHVIMGYTQVLISLKCKKVDLSGFAKKLLNSYGGGLNPIHPFKHSQA